MISHRALLPMLILAACARLAPGQNADPTPEQRLTAVLQSDASLQDKDDACSRLKLMATDKCIPAVAPLLLDPKLSHSARYVLEAMTSPAAGAALLDALGRCDGAMRLGVINSLGVRRDDRAVPVLAKLLTVDADDTAVAAATALGHIGSPAALANLRNTHANATGATRTAIEDGILECCRQLLNTKARRDALATFQWLHDATITAHVRTGAFRGIVLASGAEGVDLAVAALRAVNDADRLAVLQLVPRLKGEMATSALVTLLPELPPPIQVALLGGLAQRGDNAAASAVAALLKSNDGAVCDAAVSALALIGSADQVPALVELAGTTSGSSQRAARQALLQPLGGNETEALVRLVESSSSSIRDEAVRTLAKRGDTNAVPALLRSMNDGRSVWGAAAEALSTLAGPTQVAPLVELLANTDCVILRIQLSNTLKSVIDRTPVDAHAAVAGPVLRALRTEDSAVRSFLLSVCSRLVDPGIRAALREALASSDGDEIELARWALCESRDAELLPDLLTLTQPNVSLDTRTRAVRGAVRLATDTSNSLSDAQRLETLEKILAPGMAKQDKWFALSGLAKVPSPRSLALALPLLDDADTRNEAAQAVVAIAGHTAAQDPRATRNALNAVLAAEPTDQARRTANEILNRLRETETYITAWQVSGPYRREGCNYAALFDTAFPPEMPDVKVSDWRILPEGCDAARPWLMDILRPLGNEHQCVAYVRTRLHVDAEQPVRLEMGSDDGIKVWLNGRLIHANNTARPVQPGSDKFDGVLEEGWNELLVKITQNIMGWEYCVRIVKPGGAPLDGLQVDAAYNR